MPAFKHNPFTEILGWPTDLYRGLVWLQIPQRGVLDDLCRMTRADFSKEPYYLLTPQGTGIAAKLQADELFSAAQTSHLNFDSGDFTVWVYVYAQKVSTGTAAGNYCHIIGRDAYVSESNNQGWAIYKRPQTPAVGTPRFSGRVYNNGGSAVYDLIETTVSVTSGTFYSLALIRLGTTRILWTNGSIRSNSLAASASCAAGLRVGGYTAADEFYVLACAAWNRALRTSYGSTPNPRIEMEDLHGFPFQLAQPRRSFILMPGAGPTPVSITGATGGGLRLSGGTAGAVGNPFAGQAGGSLSVSAGVGGSLYMPITSTSGGEVLVSPGTGGALSGSVTGYVGNQIAVSGGVTGAFLVSTDRLATIFIAGVDRSAWVKTGIRRSMQLSGGSKATCTFGITSARHGIYRPAVGDEVVIYEGTTRFFAGVIDSIEEAGYGQGVDLIEQTVDCVDNGVLCDRRIIGHKYELWEGALASITMAQIAMAKLADLGVRYVTTSNDGYLGVQVFNWETVTEAYNKIAAAVGCDWRIDFFRNLYLVSKDAGYMAAPFSLTNTAGDWYDLRVGRTRSRKRNRQGVRNSQDLKTLWTDTFHGDNSRRIFVPMAFLEARPIVRVNGVDQVVVAPGESYAYDWLWQTASVMQNLAATPLGPGDTLEVLYPSPLSHVEWAEDAADIAANGLYEAVDEVRDVPTIEAMQYIAAALLAAGQQDRISASFRTDRPGLEPGMLLTINTTRPLLNDTLLIQSVESEEQGKKFFRHNVRATSISAQPSTLLAAWQRVATAGRQPKDRVVERIGFALAETIEGLDNPGLTTGVKPAVRTATKSGVARDCSLFFNCAGATTSEVVIDVLQNGVSIFGTDKMVWPAGATEVQLNFIFATDPLLVGKGDVFTVEVLSADSAAKDGVLELAVVG